MKKLKTGKLLSIMLTFVLLLGFIPAAVFASGENESIPLPDKVIIGTGNYYLEKDIEHSIIINGEVTIDLRGHDIKIKEERKLMQAHINLSLTNRSKRMNHLSCPILSMLS